MPLFALNHHTRLDMMRSCAPRVRDWSDSVAVLQDYEVTV